MLSLLRKKPEAAVGPTTPAWHPNFRNYQRLPDMKVVRTSFFVNVLAIVIALAVVLLFAYQEYNRTAVANEVAEWERRIAQDKAANTTAIADFKKFQAEEKKLQEVEAFIERKIVPSNLLIRIGQTLPPEIMIEYFDYRSTAVTIRGTVRGTPEEASGSASKYIEQLQKDPEIGPTFESISMTSLARSGQTGQLSLEVQLRLPSGPAAARKK
jgi:hypothetical protein